MLVVVVRSFDCGCLGWRCSRACTYVGIMAIWCEIIFHGIRRDGENGVYVFVCVCVFFMINYDYGCGCFVFSCNASLFALGNSQRRVFQKLK